MKVYEYGACAPRTNAAVVAEQMSLAHRYYNTLIEIERHRRAGYEEILRRDAAYATASASVVSLEAQLESTRAEIQGTKQRRRREVATPIQDARAKVIKRDLKEAWATAKAARKAAQKVPEISAAVEALNAADLLARKAARAACGVYWGSYLIVEDAVEAARKKSLDGPRFRRWDGSGHLSVQIQGGMSVAEATSGEDTRFRLCAVDPDIYASRKARRHGQGTHCSIRIGTAEDGRSPVWAEMPIYLHRPLPDDAVIKRVHLLRERLADVERWKVQLSIETAELRKAPVGTGGAVGIDIGWRQMPDGLRVAYWYDTDGRGGQLLLTDGPCREHTRPSHDGAPGRVDRAPTMIQALTKPDSLRSIRDRNLDDLKAALVPAVRALLAGDVASASRPDWLREDAATMHAWRSAARFAGLARRWAEARFPGDELAFLALTSWAKQDKHLWEWEVNQRDKAHARRREQYRIWSAQMADRYGELVLEGNGVTATEMDELGVLPLREVERAKLMDLRPLAEQAPPEDEQDAHEIARHNRVLAATSILRTCMIQAFQARGRRVILRPAPNTTRECHVCGKVELRTEALVQTCSCGAIWDQDHNAACILVRSASGGVDGGIGRPLEQAKPAGSRWKKRKDIKTARENGTVDEDRSKDGPQAAVMASEK